MRILLLRLRHLAYRREGKLGQREPQVMPEAVEVRGLFRHGLSQRRAVALRKDLDLGLAGARVLGQEQPEQEGYDGERVVR